MQCNRFPGRSPKENNIAPGQDSMNRAAPDFAAHRDRLPVLEWI
jgi:hypothetical protein